MSTRGTGRRRASGSLGQAAYKALALEGGYLGKIYFDGGTLYDVNPILSAATLGLRPGLATRVILETNSGNLYSLETVNREPILKNLSEGTRYHGLAFGGTDSAIEIGAPFHFYYIDPRLPTKSRRGQTSEIVSVLAADLREKFSATKLAKIAPGKPSKILSQFDRDFALSEGQRSARSVLVGNGKREGLEIRIGGVELDSIIAAPRGKLSHDRYGQMYFETVSGNIYCLLDTTRRDGLLQVYDVNYCRKKRKLAARTILAKSIKGVVAVVGEPLICSEFKTSEISEILLVKAKQQLSADRVREMIENRNNLLERFSQQIEAGVKAGAQFRALIDKF